MQRVTRWGLTAALLVLAGVVGLWQWRRDRRHLSVVDAFHKLYYDAAACTWSNTRWMGVQVLKNPLDLWIFQEIIHETRPDVIIEAGTYLGGSALYFAHVFDLLGRGKVITIDIKDYQGRAQHPRVHFLLGSSTDPAVVERVKSLLSPQDRVMVTLDSDHRKAHVLDEIRIYSRLVTQGSYLIVEDTNINGHPVLESFGPGPMEAVQEFRRESADFEDDHMREKFLLTHNPKGYLRRIR